MKRLAELIYNPDYHIVERIQPVHGLWLFTGWLVIFIAASFYLGPMVTERMSEEGLALPVIATQMPLLIYCLLFIILMRLSPQDLKIRLLSPMEWFLALLLALAALTVAVVVLIPVLVLHQLISPGLLQSSIEEAQALQEAITPDSTTQLILHLALIAVIPAVVEELFFRGLLFDSLMRLGPVYAITVTSIAFGAMHMMPLRIPSLIVVGFILGIFKYRTGKLTASMAVHVLYNGIMVGLTFAAKDFVDIDFNLFSLIGIG